MQTHLDHCESLDCIVHLEPLATTLSHRKPRRPGLPFAMVCADGLRGNRYSETMS